MTDTMTEAQLNEQLEAQLAQARDKNAKLASSIANNERAAAAHVKAEHDYVARLKTVDERDAALKAREQSLSVENGKVAADREALTSNQAVFEQMRTAVVAQDAVRSHDLDEREKALQGERTQVLAEVAGERAKAQDALKRSTVLEEALHEREGKLTAHEGRLTIATQKLDKEQASWRTKAKEQLQKLADSI